MDLRGVRVVKPHNVQGTFSMITGGLALKHRSLEQFPNDFHILDVFLLIGSLGELLK